MIVVLTGAATYPAKVRASLAAVAEVEEQFGGFTAEEIAAADEWAQKTVARRRSAASRTPRVA